MALSIDRASSIIAMTLLKPTIAINRLIVTKAGRVVVDLLFHAGLNIIRGENSAGKTTVVRFIAYALGAESIGFNQTAQLCDEAFLQIAANGVTVTLRRAISTSTQQSMSIYWGGIEQARAAPAEVNWQTFPFRRSESKESFSQVLFRLLEMPELRGEGGSNITMHQIFRLIYSDQETSSAELFRSERFDAAITRQAVGDYLLGIDESELYELRLRQGSLEKQLAEVKSAIRTIYATFGASGTEISLDFLNDRLNTFAHELSDIEHKLQSISMTKELTQNSTTASEEDNRLRNELDTSHTSLSELKRRRLELEEEIADSELFLSELEERIRSLDESAIAETYLGAAVFSFCPSCFSKLDTTTANSGTCTLCKSVVSPDSAKSQLARMRNELALQQRESILIREQQTMELEQITRDIPGREVHLRNIEKEFQRNRSNWRPPQEIAIQQLARALGAKEQEIKNTLELKKLAALLDTNTQKAGQIEADLEWTRGRIEAVKREQTNRRQVAYLAVAENLRLLLRGDLPRQNEFSSAEEVNIDFGANRVSVDGQTQFSASSMVYLRHSFHLALLLASGKQPFFRFPRLVIVDGVEDGGMEPDRSFNFQKLIREKSDSMDVAHQIILATSQICPDLDNSEYVVGSAFTHDKKSIAI